MRFCFLCDEFYPNYGANSLIIKTICEELVKKGNECYVLPFNYSNDLDIEDCFDKINIIRIIKHDTFTQLRRDFSFSFLFNYLAKKTFRRKSLLRLDRFNARKKIFEFFEKHNIDVVVSINCSIELSFPLLWLKKRRKLKPKWLLYFLDPFLTNKYYLENYKYRSLKKIQDNLLFKCDYFLANNLISNELIETYPISINKKILKIEFPKFTKPISKPCEDDFILERNFINIIYTGSKNDKVRSVEYFMQVCNALPSGKIKFYFIGKGWEGFESKSSNLIVLGEKSPLVITNIQLKGDFLLNIGNNVANQLPSKLIEYMTTGKPIINFYKNEDCPSLELLKTYDHLNIFEKQDIAIAASKIIDFVESHHFQKSFDDLIK